MLNPLNHDLKWIEYRDAAIAAQHGEQYDQAELYYHKALNEFNKYPYSAQLAITYYELFFNLYISTGQYKKLLKAENEYYIPRRKGADISDQILQTLDMARIYMAQGDWDKFLISIRDSENLGLNAHSQVNDEFFVINEYPLLVEYCIELEEFDKAEELCSRMIKHAQRHQILPNNVAIEKARLGKVLYYKGDYRSSLRQYNDILIAFNTQAFPPDTDLIEAITLAGRAENHQNNPNDALALWDTLLTQLKSDQNRIERANVYNAMGKLYFKFNRMDDARIAFTTAMSLRRETGTQTHSKYADALKDLADVYASDNNLCSATQCLRKSIETYDSELLPSHPCISPALVALYSTLNLSDQSQSAAPLKARLETILKRPLGPWKEDFLDTVQFYCMLLKRAGKTAESTQLEQLCTQRRN